MQVAVGVPQALGAPGGRAKGLARPYTGRTPSQRAPWNAKGGLVHWTHRDPAGRHVTGWLRVAGHTYE